MPEERDGWSKIEVISKIGSAFGAILLPIILLCLGNKFTKDQNNAKRATDLIQHLSSNNLRERRIAINVTQYFAKKNQLPEELLPVLLDIAMNDSDKDVSVGAVQSLKKVAKENKNLAASIQQRLSALPKRVYIQIANEDQRNRAKNIQIDLYQNGVFVPGIEIVGGNPERSDRATVLYFDPNDKSTAETIEKVLKSKGFTAVNLSLLPDMQAKSGTLEIWFAERIAPSGGLGSGIFGDTVLGD